MHPDLNVMLSRREASPREAPVYETDDHVIRSGFADISSLRSG
jgi:hypothetical protein